MNIQNSEDGVEDAESSVDRSVLDELHQCLFDASADPTYVLQGSTIVAANAAASEALGWPTVDLVGRKLHEIDARFSEADIEEALLRLEPGETQPFETVHRTREGELIHFEIHCRLFDADGQRYLHAVARDVTRRDRVERELRESEKKYRTLVDGMLDMVWVIGGNGRILDVNQATTEVLGYSRSELLDLRLWDIDKSMKPAEILERSHSLIDDTVHLFETTHTKKDGSEIAVEIKSCLVPYAGGSRGLCLVREIGERKRAEAERLRLKKLESIGLLAGGIAHDFNNLLMSLYGNVELAKFLVEGNAEALELLQAADSSLERAKALTQQLLTFASGGKPVKEPLQLGDLLSDTATFSLAGSDVELVLDVDPDLWPVYADAGQLSQVISNLVINAQQASCDGGAVEVAASNVVEEERRYVEIRVRDSGVGIGAEEIERIFDPYFTTKDNGSGLGLAVSYSVIREHGGSIRVESALGEGSMFTVALPASEQDVFGQGDGAGERAAEACRPLRLLVMDDEESIRDLLRGMLARLGHEVVLSSEGGEAVDLYRQALDSGQRFDVVITDLTVPGGLGGAEAAKQILAADPRATVVASSGYATDPVMADFSAHGFSGALSKPYRFDDLRKKLTDVSGAGRRSS